MSGVSLQRASGVRFRYDKFGGLAWRSSGLIYKLSAGETAVLDVLERPRTFEALTAALPQVDVVAAIRMLSNERLTEPTRAAAEDHDLGVACKRAMELAVQGEQQALTKPFWVHLQPFTFCNQRCIHCYCHGGADQPKKQLALSTWRKVVDAIAAFGVLEVYVTGGENLIVDDYYRITEYILAAGCTTGLSTNAMAIPQRALDFIARNRFSTVQVSLDGACAETNDFIRGRPGAFDLSIAGIRKLRAVTRPILNMVVNRRNLSEIEALIRVGQDLGIESFKFFPQKSVGRAVDVARLKLTDCEWNAIPFEAYKESYSVNIDFLESGATCGSGFSGFSINEVGDVFPCVFGSHNPATRVGSVLTESLSYLWFEAPAMIASRRLSNRQPCTRCEPT